MAQFSPRAPYTISTESTRLNDFAAYTEDYVVRPPYQRKTVWSQKKKQALWDSLLRRYYIPRIILREVHLSEDFRKLEVVDGQQRITSVVEFFENRLRLPRSLEDVRPDLPGKTYEELPTDARRYVDQLKFDVDLVIGIDDPHDPDHQEIASEIFWRLQQGETLNFMEIAHARLSSLPRNFIVKYADDITFNFQKYEPEDDNPDKHAFFSIIDRRNDRMQHLALLARFLILERDDGAADIRDIQVSEYIDQGKVVDGIDNLSYENEPEAKRVLETMDEFVKVFKRDQLVEQGEGMKEFRVEYFIISVFLLIRHLSRLYLFREEQRQWFYEFVMDFYNRWKEKDESDVDVIAFSDNRQQSQTEIEVRQRIMRQLFFDWLTRRDHEMKTLDGKRSFSEAQRIRIYRRDRGLCQACLDERKPEKEAEVPWREYDADHIIAHAQGGQTTVENARVLCRYHNRSAGAALAER